MSLRLHALTIKFALKQFGYLLSPHGRHGFDKGSATLNLFTLPGYFKLYWPVRVARMFISLDFLPVGPCLEPEEHAGGIARKRFFVKLPGNPAICHRRADHPGSGADQRLLRITFDGNTTDQADFILLRLLAAA